MMGVGNGGGRGASSRCLPTARGFSLHASCVHPRIRTWTICAVRRDGMCFVSREAASGCAAAGPFQIETPRAGSSRGPRRARPRRQWPAGRRAAELENRQRHLCMCLLCP